MCSLDGLSRACTYPGTYTCTGWGLGVRENARCLTGVSFHEHTLDLLSVALILSLIIIRFLVFGRCYCYLCILARRFQPVRQMLSRNIVPALVLAHAHAYRGNISPLDRMPFALQPSQPRSPTAAAAAPPWPASASAPKNHARHRVKLV